jgi:hypothetical protein
LSTGATGKLLEFDAEASGVGGVGDTYFLAFWVDVSVAADLVAETVTEVAGGLSGVSVAEAGLAELVLGVVLGGGERRVAVSDGVGGGDGGSCGDSGVGRGGADASEWKGTVISVGIHHIHRIRRIELGRPQPTPTDRQSAYGKFKMLILKN